VYRHPSHLIGSNWWFVQRSSDEVLTGVEWGRHDDFDLDFPMPADYDGDGRSDHAVYHPPRSSGAAGAYYLLQSTAGVAIVPSLTATYSNWVVPGDYDGDGRDDIAVTEAQSGRLLWLIRLGNGAVLSVPWGATGDKPAWGDYDGDGKTDPAVWRPGTPSIFYVRRSSDDGMTVIPWGFSTDQTVARPFSQ
jgi:hypothetical protein